MLFTSQFISPNCYSYQDFHFSLIILNQHNQQIQFKKMISRFTHLSLLVSILFHVSLNQNIIDFSYSEYIKKTGRAISEGARLSIEPYKLTGDFQFPNACYLHEKLDSGNFNVNIENLENYDYVTELKQEFIKLLRLEEKIKHKTLSIQQITQTGKLETASNGYLSLVSSEEMKDLEMLEERLHFLDGQIKQKQNELQILVKHSIESSQNNQFIKAAIDFDIESYKLRREYLKTLLTKSEAQPSKIKTDYEKYFQDLRIKFDEENELIKDLDAILKDYNQIGQLKEKISSLQGLIKAEEEMLKMKRDCAEELDKLKKSQSSQKKQIHILMSNLREMKKEASHKDNKYCKGVAAKLEEQVKALLHIFDHSFNCPRGKEVLELKLQEHKGQLQDAKARLQKFENHAGIDHYKDKFQQNRDYIKSKNIEIQTFKIDPYKHDPDQIRELIIQTERELSDAITKQQQLKTSSPQAIDYVEIQELVDSIKNMKWNYCHRYEEYLQKSSRIETKISKYESDMEYQNKLVSMYLEQKGELQKLQEEFESLRQQIIEKMTTI